MQRYYETVRDGFGNLASGVTANVYLTGTTTAATLYSASSTSDSPAVTIVNPIITTSNGEVAFAVADGDYDIVISGSNLPATLYRYRINFLDGTTVSAAPFSQVALSMPAEFAVSGSPAGASGTLTVSKATEIKNTFWAGPITGADAQPAFRVLEVADLTLTACTLTGNQTVAGAKTFSGAAAFGSTLAVTGAATFSGAVAHSSTSTFENTLTLDKDVDIFVNTASPASGYALMNMPLDVSLGTGSGTISTPVTIGATGLRGCGFTAAAVNCVNGSITLPHDYAAGTDIIPYITWTTSGTDTGNVSWGLEYSIITGHNTGVLPAVTTATVLTAAQGTALRIMYSEFAAITGTTFLPNTIIVYRVFRDGAAGTDTCTDPAVLFNLGLAYKSTRFSIKNRVPNFYT